MKVTFNNSKSPFFDAVKEKVNHYFENKEVKLTGNIRLYSKAMILLISTIAVYAWLVFFTPGPLLGILLSAILGVQLSFIGFNIMHDGAHGSFSSKNWVNNGMAFTLNVMGGSRYIWKIKHNIIHHSYTNIAGMDDDIDNEPWLRMNKDQKKRWFHKFQHTYWLFIYSLAYLAWVFYLDYQKYFSRKIGETPIRQIKFKDHLGFWSGKVLNLLGFVVIPLIFVSFTQFIVGFLVMMLVCGAILSVVFQMAHVVEQAEFPHADVKTQKIDTEWAIHQVLTTSNFGTKSKFLTWCLGGLNFQIEHHLFPKVSHVHYPKLSKLVEETCREFGLPYNNYPTMMMAVRSHVRYLKEIGNE